LLELVLLAVYAIGSTAYNIHQAKEIGELTSARDGFRNAAVQCGTWREKQREDDQAAADRRATIGQSIKEDIRKADYAARVAIESNRDPCGAAVPAYGGGLVDTTRQLRNRLDTRVRGTSGTYD
jgi:hypothetical protein